MRHGEPATAWALHDELIEKGMTPSEDAWDALFKEATKTEGDGGSEAVSEAENREKLLGILLYMRNNQIYPQHRLVSSIKSWFER